MAAPQIARHFGRTLQRERKRADLSQERLGLLASLHRTEVGLIERGIRVPRIDTLVKLAGALEVPAADLLQGIDWRPTDPSVGTFQIRGEGAR